MTVTWDAAEMAKAILFGNAKDDDGQPVQITIEEIEAMTDTLMSMAYRPHVHVVHPDGDVCLDCGERRPL